jgi:hypothetical protein
MPAVFLSIDSGAESVTTMFLRFRVRLPMAIQPPLLPIELGKQGSANVIYHKNFAMDDK